MKVHRYPFVGISKHFGFIYFNTKEEAQNAKKALNYTKLVKKPLRIVEIKPFEKEANLFFNGFGKDVALTAVENFFAQYGSVLSVSFSYDANVESRGYGWVQYESLTDATKCL